MSIELLIARYGLLAIFLGAGIEGETVVLLAGVLSHRGFLPFWPVALAAAFGSFVADQLLFFAGRHARSYPAVQRVLARPTISAVSRLLERHPTGFVFAFRFIYGLRTVSPVAIGTTQIPAAKFVLLNAAAALVWGPLFTALGYFAGQTIEQLLGRLPLPRHLMVATVAFIVIVIALAVVFRKQLMKLAAKL